MPKLYYDTVEVGDPVTPLTKPPVTRVQIAKFAGASLDYSPLHIDDDFAKTAGYGGVFAHGAISMAFAVEAVSRWLENGRILSSTATFQKLVWPGDILTAKGVVVNHHEVRGEPRIEVDVWAENQNHDIVMKGSITCVLWRDEKEEKKTKGNLPAISAATQAAANKGEGAHLPGEGGSGGGDDAEGKKPAKKAEPEPQAEAKPEPKKPEPKKPEPKAEPKKVDTKKPAPAKKADTKKPAAKTSGAKKAAAKKPASKTTGKKKKK